VGIEYNIFDIVVSKKIIPDVSVGQEGVMENNLNISIHLLNFFSDCSVEIL